MKIPRTPARQQDIKTQESMAQAEATQARTNYQILNLYRLLTDGRTVLSINRTCKGNWLLPIYDPWSLYEELEGLYTFSMTYVSVAKIFRNLQRTKLNKTAVSFIHIYVHNTCSNNGKIPLSSNVLVQVLQVRSSEAMSPSYI